MVLRADKLSLSLAGGRRAIFSDLSFELGEGALGLVNGGAGSGKTLLGLSLCGFLPLWVGNPDLRGTIDLLGSPLVQNDYRPEVGIVLENPYTQLSGIKRTVREELAFPLECRGERPELIGRSVERLAGALDITRLLDRSAWTLSGGELQRLIIACSLITMPRFLFLDRFLTEIDDDFRPRLVDIVRGQLETAGGAALIAEDPWLLPDRGYTPHIRLGQKCGDTQAFSGDKYGDVPPAVLTQPGRDVLGVDDLTFSYESGVRVIRNLSFAVGEGEVLFVRGPNGAGKTTLAKIIAGILKPMSGTIHIDSLPVSGLEQYEIMSLVGMSLQNPGLHICRKAVREELNLARSWGNDPGGLVEMLGLDSLLDSHPLELTQAEKKRLGLALSYGMKRKVVLLDEPSQYQDSEGFRRVIDAVRFMAGEGKAVVIISHDPRFDRAFPGGRSIRLSRADTG